MAAVALAWALQVLFVPLHLEQHEHASIDAAELGSRIASHDHGHDHGHHHGHRHGLGHDRGRERPSLAPEDLDADRAEAPEGIRAAGKPSDHVPHPVADHFDGTAVRAVTEGFDTAPVAALARERLLPKHFAPAVRRIDGTPDRPRPPPLRDSGAQRAPPVTV